jgi:hypothetical protein
MRARSRREGLSVCALRAPWCERELEEARRIDEPAGDVHAHMHVRSGRATGVPREPDLGAPRDRVALADRDFAQMSASIRSRAWRQRYVALG